MNLKSNKGVTGADAAIGIGIAMIFVSFIAALFVNIAITSSQIKRKSIATNLAINAIEGLKQTEFTNLKESEEVSKENCEIEKVQALTVPNGYDLKIKVEKYDNKSTMKKLMARVTYSNNKSTIEEVYLETLYEHELTGTLISTEKEERYNAVFLGGGKDKTITRDKIERVNLRTDIGTHTLEDENCWDVSQEKNGSILAWYEDIDNDGLYEITIASNGGKIKANPISKNLFYCIGMNSKCDDEICIDGLENLDTSKVTNMVEMFCECGSNAMKSLILPENFDTSKVTNMSRMFDSCGSKSMINLTLPESFNTSNVTNMERMFYLCGFREMKELKLPSSFNTINVEKMSTMFMNCGFYKMTSLTLPESFDTSNVTNMSYMFDSCGYIAMTSLILPESFNTSNVTNMSRMFDHCGYDSMTSLTLPESFNTSNVTDMSYMFYECGYDSMTSLTLPESFDTSNVTDMSYMFYGCGYTAMTSLTLPESFNTSNVTDMSYMFDGCGYTAMTSLILPESFDTSKVTNMSSMFAKCGNTKMTELDLGTMSFENVTSQSQIFYQCGLAITKIYVKDETAKTFVKSNKNSSWSDDNIIIKTN